MAFVPVPGSEVFNSRILPLEEVIKGIPSSVKLHSVSEEEVQAVDPLTYEVVRHRMWAITDMMGEALKRMSGSLVVTECNDFDVAVTDEYGDVVQVGLFNTELVASIDLAVKWILKNRAENPGIEEGDMFLLNDPWVGGGLHQNDVALLAPIFHDGRLFAWTAAVAHQADLGGVSPGSWTPRAENVFWESLPTPPVKMVKDYQIQRDVEDVYLRRSRVPKIVALDLRAKMGANMVGLERIRALIDKYSPDTVKAVMKRQMDDAEHRLRERLRSMEDGTWHAVSYQEQSKQGDRGVHKIVLTMTKKDDHLTFDFTGTDPQSGMINCTYTGMYGGITAAMLPVLCGDMPWAAGGLVRCIDIVSEEGTLNNCTFPGGIGKGSVASAWATSNVVTECLSKMLDTHIDLSQRTQSVCCGTWDLCVMAGLDQREQPFATMITDSMGAGFGAGSDHDGVDTAGLLIIPMGKMPDVEMNEFVLPMLYLWRREETDSGGPGKFRGGVTASLCFISHDTPAPMAQVISGSGKAVPMNVGLAGGYPGNTQVDLTVRDANAKELFARGIIPGSLQEIEGRHELKSCEEESYLAPGEAHYMYWQSGGGYGDPLLRDPAAVRHDVEEFKVSLSAARGIYGVVLDEDSLEVDAAGTERIRDEIRDNRRQLSRQGGDGNGHHAH
ncbi:hydantoinase B/oxoprolinase family protein [Rubrobacter marinus]|uniref:hydantoinase B/oxoprolinase family protein n=1 Tax=Rubrobacter marinus TaxID=2653852 RepID=UPI001A9EA5C3|nr:hydantoinase B/oxoprolinase family protein [Rubrobacter marinus]